MLKSLFLQDVQSQRGDSCSTTVEDLEWGPDVHPEMWKSLTSSAGTDLRLDLQMTWWQSRLEAVITWDWCLNADE